MGQYEIHAFVCTQGPWCPRDGNAEGVHKRLKKLVGEHGMKSRIRINHSGCLNQCGHGPMMVVYPENVWYAHLTPEKAEEIFQAHFLRGCPVERYTYHNAPGANKVPRDEEGNLLGSSSP